MQQENLSWLTIWSPLEAGIGIVASSLATLRPLLRQFSRRLSSTIRTDQSKQSGYPSGYPSNASARYKTNSRFGPQISIEEQGLPILEETELPDKLGKVETIGESPAYCSTGETAN